MNSGMNELERQELVRQLSPRMHVKTPGKWKRFWWRVLEALGLSD